MATTNLHLAKHLDGTPVNIEDIKAGLNATFPSGAGGVVQCKCTKVDHQSASFESLNEHWPLSYKLKFNQPDLNLDELNMLFDILANMKCSISSLTVRESQLVRRGAELGYVNVRSQTQVYWMDKGVSKLAALAKEAS